MCQMTAMPMTIGLPIRSLIFCLSLLSVMVLSDRRLPCGWPVVMRPEDSLPALSASFASSAALAIADSAAGLTAVQNGLTKKMPSPLSVPTYLPNRVSTSASFGRSTLMPANSSQHGRHQ